MFSVSIFLWIHRPSPKEHLQMSQYVPLPRWSPGALRWRPSRHPVFALSQGPDVAARPVPGPKSQRKMLGLRGQKPIGKYEKYGNLHYKWRCIAGNIIREWLIFHAIFQMSRLHWPNCLFPLDLIIMAAWNHRCMNLVYPIPTPSSKVLGIIPLWLGWSTSWPHDPPAMFFGCQDRPVSFPILWCLMFAVAPRMPSSQILMCFYRKGTPNARKNCGFA